jgi:hypothetical protein
MTENLAESHELINFKKGATTTLVQSSIKKGATTTYKVVTCKTNMWIED